MSGTAADQAEIRQLVESYAAATDGGDGDAVAALFVPDGEFVMYLEPNAEEPTSHRHGRAEIATAVGKIRDFNATYHSIGSCVVEVDGETAHGETRCEAHHLIGESPQLRDYTMYIRYVEDLARVDGRWLFRRRELRVLWIAINAVESA
jgi:uncharacterized protein (TIGR02246 family)